MTVLERGPRLTELSSALDRTTSSPVESEVFDEVIHGAAGPAEHLIEERRRTHGLRVVDVYAMLGAVIAAVSFTAVLTTHWAPVDGPLAFFVIGYFSFVAFYALLISLDENSPGVRDRVMSVAVHSLAVTLFSALVFVVTFTVFRGAEALPYLNFYVEDMSLAGPLDPLSAGGVTHAIAGTLIQITIALIVTIPLGILTALYLTEVPGPFSRFVRTIVEAMTALPSIVAGLFIYATFILILGMQKSGLAAALAISVMMLPIMIRSADVVFRLVPATLREASIGLGAGQWRTVWHVVLPTSRSGLTTSIILATARGIGETSPVLLTSGFTAAMNLNPFQDPMVSLPLAVFQFVKSPEPTMIARGFGTAAVLMALVLVLFAFARVIGGQTVAKQEARIRRRQAALRLVRRLLRRVAQVASPVIRPVIAAIRGLVRRLVTASLLILRRLAHSGREVADRALSTIRARLHSVSQVEDPLEPPTTLEEHSR